MCYCETRKQHDESNSDLLERITELESLLRDSRQYIEAVIRLADNVRHEHPKATAFLEEVDKALAQ